MSQPKGISMLLLSCALALPCAAQVSSGEVAGAITDSTGAGVPNAKVVATNPETNTVVRETVAASDGTYIMTFLPPGSYVISAEAPGFRKTVQSGITLETNQRAKVDIQLQVGQVSETVEVAGHPPLLESQSSSLGAVIGQQVIAELPLNGRNFVTLALLTPG